MFSLKIGEFRITEAYGDKEKALAIYHDSGEGGDFCRETFAKSKKIEEAIREFYEENF